MEYQSLLWNQFYGVCSPTVIMELLQGAKRRIEKKYADKASGKRKSD